MRISVYIRIGRSNVDQTRNDAGWRRRVFAHSATTAFSGCPPV